MRFFPATIGFVVIGTGMGPVYPAIQYFSPKNFGEKYSAVVIGLQMASAYIGSTFMPMVFWKYPREGRDWYYAILSIDINDS